MVVFRVVFRTNFSGPVNVQNFRLRLVPCELGSDLIISECTSMLQTSRSKLLRNVSVRNSPLLFTAMAITLVIRLIMHSLFVTMTVTWKPWPCSFGTLLTWLMTTFDRLAVSNVLLNTATVNTTISAFVGSASGAELFGLLLLHSENCIIHYRNMSARSTVVTTNSRE